MSKYVRIYRSIALDYEVQQFVELTVEEYAHLVESLDHKEGERIDKPDFDNWDDAIDKIIGLEGWETISNEPTSDRIYEMWVEKND
jgi:hypothetical protein